MKPEVNHYLKRICYDGPLDVSAAALARLQECHLFAVPYENLDVWRRVPLSLEIPNLFDKIVLRQRGGFCFELNELYGWLLRELGYEVTDLFGRFWRDEPAPPPKRRHHVLKVNLDGTDYLCDVGVGGVIPRRPIPMEERREQPQDTGIYRLEKDSFYGWVLCEKHDGEWRWIYSFTEEPQLSKDYVMACHWCETAPDSPFIKAPIVSLQIPEGRLTVAGDEFRRFTAEGVDVFVPQTDDERRIRFEQDFGIRL
ncbi:arylamine N-acetyltransferase family protein [Gorillibacterium massiliense]|uniref:arylamine N-acetyltransferase family protein n=1 Tax=Gorillibacterium massiliense TaxID=1280390 RepID=UPI0004AD9C1F|nr:arylamine N-acetyltransferase [Gorillibacterium massiliense]